MIQNAPRAIASLLAGAMVAVAAINPATANDKAVTFNDPAEVAKIKAMEEELNTAESMKDIIKHYAPDAIVLDIFAPGIFKGKDAIYKGFQDQFDHLKSMTHEIPEINVATNGKFACAMMQLHFDSEMKDGTKMSISIRQLDALKKINGEWKVIQQHIAMPADAKTGMALMNAPLVWRGPLQWSATPLQPAVVSPEQGKAEIKAWMEKGVYSAGIDQLMSYYGPTDDVILYDSFYPGHLRGMKEIRDYYAPMMGSYKDIKVKIPEMIIDSDGSFGVQIDTQDMVLTMNDGSTKYISLRQSDCMRRVDGKWYSFFEMISHVTDPKTGKAIMENPAAFK